MWEPADRLSVSLAPVLREPAAAVVTRQPPQRAQVSNPVALVPSWDGTEIRCRAFTLRCRKNALSTDPLDLHTTVESFIRQPRQGPPIWGYRAGSVSKAKRNQYTSCGPLR